MSEKAHEQVTAYLAPAGYEADLHQDLLSYGKKILKSYGRLLIASGPPAPTPWSQNTWLNPREIPITSISTGAHALKAIQRNWALYSFQHHRRAQLISELLPRVPSKPIPFPEQVLEQKKENLGSWTLVEPNLILASPECSSRFPNGEISFIENKSAPPSRAYLKLWEALTLVGHLPKPGERCLELGSSPGGWTWALQKLGSTVLSVDKAPLDPAILQLPGVEYINRDAFQLKPEDIGPIDWFFSDVICYPHKLLDLVRKWMNATNCSKYICTVKFQGISLNSSDLQAIKDFATISGSVLCHLSHNKHELTWICVK